MTLRSDGMTQRDLIQWAKEEIIDGIDRKVYRLEHDGAQPMDYDELHQIVIQRNRIAKLFALPIRGPYDITNDHKTYQADD